MTGITSAQFLMVNKVKPIKRKRGNVSYCQVTGMGRGPNDR